jgi:phage-related protein
MASSSYGPVAVRASGIGRAFYCFLVGKRVVVVHAFVKKTQQTPDKELKLARKRMKELNHG